MANEIKYPITEVELPSKGLIYSNDLVPAVVKIRPMTTKEEKILYASNVNAIDLIIKSCIVEPADLNLDLLIIPDKYAILINLRIISLGDVYMVKHKCPNCGEYNTFDIKLSELPINFLDETFIEPYPIELKGVGETVGVRLLRGRDLDDVDEMVKRIKRNLKTAPEGDIGYTMRMAKYIQTVDGNKVRFDEALAYVESWTMLTSVDFRNALDDIKVGYDIDLLKDCQFCREELDFSLPFSGEFFRPSRR